MTTMHIPSRRADSRRGRRQTHPSRSGRLKQLSVAGLIVFALVNSALAIAATPKVLREATAPARVEQRERQVRQVRPENYDLQRYPVIDRQEKHWRNILWTTALVEPQEAYVAEALNGILSLTRRSGLSNAQMRTVDMAMQVGTQLYLGAPETYASLANQFQQTIETSPDPQWTAMALSALVKAGATPADVTRWSDRIRRRFPNWSKDVHLYTTLQEVAQSSAPQELPPVKDLLEWTIAPGQPHLYVICPADRGMLCQAILKDRSGKFVQQSGQMWSVPLLLRSLHGLNWNFERGQTPQGVYRIEGTVPQPDTEFFRAYGQFDLVKLFVPFEPGVREFLPGKKGVFTGSVAEYLKLLPPSWRNHFPMQQSYWAGKAGRSLFRIHGTGEATSFFSGNARYPMTSDWNPTIGCLSALELYDDQGRLQQADMPKLLDALKTAGGRNFSGYMIVVDAPGISQTSLISEAVETAMR